MDLCSTYYGFLHLPSLIVFANPFSDYPEVRALLTSGKSLTEIAHASTSLSQDQRRDLAHRITTWVHERRHFHDVLLTPVGNAWFFAELARAAALLPLLSALRPFAGSVLHLPLTTETEGLGEHMRAYQLFGAPHSRLLASAPQAFEASAVSAQLAFTMRHLSDDGFLRLTQDFFRDPRYGYPLSLLGRLSYGEDDAGSIAVSYNRLLLLALSDPPIGSIKSHDETLRELLERGCDVRLSGARADVLRTVVDKTWSAVRGNILLNETRNANWLAGLEKPLSLVSSDLANPFRRIADEFIRVAASMRQRVCDAPDEYCNLSRYLESDWPEPIAAIFKSNGDYEFLSDAKTRCPFDRALWSQFAQALAPFSFLVEDPPFAHPLMKLWRANLEQNLGIRIARRRGSSRHTGSSKNPSSNARKVFKQSKSATTQRTPSIDGKLGRNDPCWCGGGLKFKKCHGR